MPNEELPAPGAAAPPPPADAPAGSRTAALDDPFVITASGERVPVAAAGGSMEIRRRGESAAYTLEESEGGTRMRAHGLDGGTPSFGADVPPVAAAPQPSLAHPSGTPAAPDSSGAEGGAHAVEGHAVQALAAPVLVTETGEKIVMDGSAPNVSIRRKAGDEADGPQRLTLGLDGKPMDPRDAFATRAGADASPLSEAPSPSAVVPAQRPAEPASAPPASSASSNAAALAAARRLIIGGSADTAPSPVASPAPALPIASGPASVSTDPPASVSEDPPAPVSADPAARVSADSSPSASADPPASASADPPAPVASAPASIDPTPAPVSASMEPAAAPPAPIEAASVPAQRVEEEAAAPLREGASELERSGRTAPLQRGDDAPVDVRSEEMDEILTMIPSVLVRYGISAVFATLAVLLIISWFIAYPDVVKGKVVLTTPTPPVRVVARAPGEVERVFVADRADVAPGAPLVLLRSPARYADVTALSAALDRLEPALAGSGPVPAADLNARMVLGDVQPAYTAFLQAYSDYRVFTDDGFHAQKVASLRRQVADHESLRARLAAQQTVQEQQMALAERARDRVRQMAAQQLAATADVEKAEQDFLQVRYAVENGRSALTSNEIQLTSSQSALLDLEQRRSGDGQRLLTELRSAHRALRAAMATWDQQYLVRAPVAGTVSYFRDLNENQYVAAAEALVAVVPSGGELVGRVQLQGAGAGKVAVGQRVLVRLEGYPYRQYGVLEGRVQSVSQLGFEQGERSEVTYRAVVSLSRGLVTSYGRRLQFREEMRGEIDVITEDMRLLERLFNQFRSLRADG